MLIFSGSGDDVSKLSQRMPQRPTLDEVVPPARTPPIMVPPAPHSGSFRGWVSLLVHQHRERLARAVRREGVRADDALDCVQEAFLSFLQLPQAPQLVGQPDDSARMLVILARNIARNRRRRHDYARPHLVDDATVPNLEDDGMSADDVIAMAEQKAMALGCLATLNEVQRGVVQLRLVDEVPGESVALQFGITASHVAVLLFRAKQQLRRCVEDASSEQSQPRAVA